MKIIQTIFFLCLFGLQGCSYFGWSDYRPSTAEEEEPKTDPDDRLYH